MKSSTATIAAGGLGGAAGVFITCPLDVVQTRFQSSILNNLKITSPQQLLNSASIVGSNGSSLLSTTLNPVTQTFSYLKQVYRFEGFSSLYKGLGPALFGVVPSRALYFFIYETTKDFLSKTRLSDGSCTHMLSALSASWSVSTATNPVWFIKTRLQLDLTEKGKSKTVKQIIREELSTNGIRGLYRGLSASYIGASETMMYFVIYEKYKQRILSNKQELSIIDYSAGSFIAKMIATFTAYPHEVVRTRLRQEEAKKTSQKMYKGFFQTLKKVYCDEGVVGLYGGMSAHLVRQVPNTVIMFLVYEYIFDYLTRN